jgi:hypothetical protein
VELILKALRQPAIEIKNDAWIFSMMDVVASAAFALGVLLQAASMIWGKTNNLASFLAAILFVLLLVVCGASRGNDLEFITLGSAFIFAIVFAIGYRKEIMPAIDERMILIFTILLCFVCLGFSWWTGTALGLSILGIAVIAALALALTDYKLNWPLRLIFYAWAIVMATVFAGLQLASAFNSQQTLIDFFFSGMIFMYAISFITYVLYMIPLPGKFQSFADRIQQWKEYLELMGNKYSNKQMSKIEAVIIIIALGGAYLINSLLGIIPTLLFVNIVLLLTSNLEPRLAEQKTKQFK